MISSPFLKDLLLKCQLEQVREVSKMTWGNRRRQKGLELHFFLCTKFQPIIPTVL
jgi:hypothetical protein